MARDSLRGLEEQSWITREDERQKIEEKIVIRYVGTFRDRREPNRTRIREGGEVEEGGGRLQWKKRENWKTHTFYSVKALSSTLHNNYFFGENCTVRVFTFLYFALTQKTQSNDQKCSFSRCLSCNDYDCAISFAVYYCASVISDIRDVVLLIITIVLPLLIASHIRIQYMTVAGWKACYKCVCF